MKDLKIKVGTIGLLDMLKFKNQVKTREKVIDAADPAPLPTGFRVNETAKRLHPERQLLKITDIISRGKDVKTFVFASAKGQSLAPFRAGQYLSFSQQIDGSAITRPVSICSSPGDAREGIYAITVKRAGFASDYMLDHWKIGDEVTASAPLGNFYYTRLRDAGHVIGLAGGSGITPFVSMARAIADGDEDFRLTLLYGSRTREDILFREELEACARQSKGKFRVVHILSHEEAEGFEHGFITAELIRKYSQPGENSYFICGPQAMYNFVAGELEKIGPERKWVRRELFGASKTPWELPGYPEGHRGKTYQVTVTQCSRRRTCTASADESLLTALERAGLTAPSHCRSGECGWCRSKLISGQVFIPDSTDGRRAADREYGYIHPCVSYPLSDVEIQIPKG